MTRNCATRSCRNVSIEDGRYCRACTNEMLYVTRRESPWVQRAREGRLMPKALS